MRGRSTSLAAHCFDYAVLRTGVGVSLQGSRSLATDYRPSTGVVKVDHVRSTGDSPVDDTWSPCEMLSNAHNLSPTIPEPCHLRPYHHRYSSGGWALLALPCASHMNPRYLAWLDWVYGHSRLRLLTVVVHRRIFRLCDARDGPSLRVCVFLLRIVCVGDAYRLYLPTRVRDS